MWASVKVKSAGALPLTAQDMRARLRIDTTAEDDLLAAFLAAAASEIDGPDGAGVAMMAQTWTRTLDGWAGQIVLPGWPVTGVAEIRYLDPDGAWQVLDHAVAFRLAAGADPAQLVRRPGAALPALHSGPGTVEIDYTLGRATAAEVDPGLVAALSLMAGHFYENREATAPGQVHEVPLGARHILARFRRGVVA
jgi:uncharacterized phiE125 gp8 family phage protein